jgi:hypothetical protein
MIYCFSYVEVSHDFVEFFDFSPLFPVVAKLTGDFTSLKEPTDDSDIAIVVVFLADGPDFVESERRIKPREPRESLGFQSSGPSSDPNLKRLE